MLSFDRPAHALVRPPGASFPHCLKEVPARIELALARDQHRAYVAALRRAGVSVTQLVADAALPDAVFPEDTAVIFGRHALLTRPGAPSRRAEVAGVGFWLRRHSQLHHVDAPGTLEGGDVLRVGEIVFCGISERTNPAGFDALARVAGLQGLRCVPIDLPGRMHLKGYVTAVDAGTVVIDSAVLAGETFSRRGLRVVEAAEEVGANVLALGSTVLVPQEAPVTAARLAAAGFAVSSVPGTEFHKGDGRLTCLSLRVPRAGAWCA